MSGEEVSQVDALEALKELGLTRYEAQVYLTLLKRRHDTARRLARESGVPRTKIYSVLEDLVEKGWVTALSGWPLLFKPKDPNEVVMDMTSKFHRLLESAREALNKEAKDMMEKFVIAKCNVGLEEMAKAVSEANTVWVSNATRELYDSLEGHLKEGAEVKMLMFPGEVPPKDERVGFKQGSVKIVNLVGNIEVPAMNVLVEEERSFTLYKDPLSKRWQVQEMLYDDCVSCFRDWYQMGWDQSTPVCSGGKEE